MIARIAGAAALGLALSACAASTGTKADIAAAEQALTALETLAANYTGLPACGAGAPVVCADPAVVARIRAADNTAYAAVKAVEAHAGTIEAALTAISNFKATIPGA